MNSRWRWRICDLGKHKDLASCLSESKIFFLFSCFLNQPLQSAASDKSKSTEIHLFFLDNINCQDGEGFIFQELSSVFAHFGGIYGFSAFWYKFIYTHAFLNLLLQEGYRRFLLLTSTKGLILVLWVVSSHSPASKRTSVSQPEAPASPTLKTQRSLRMSSLFLPLDVFSVR